MQLALAILAQGACCCISV